MTRNKFFCKCGNVVGEYQIKDGLGGIGLNLSSYCHNYCSMCGEKVDKEKFKEILDLDLKLRMNRKKEEKEILQELLDSMVNGGKRK